MLASAALVAACRPDAASNNRRAPGDEFDPSVVLDGRRATAAEGAMSGVAQGQQTRPLEPAKDGVRWGDVEMALNNVARGSFVGISFYERTDRTIVGSTVLPDGQRGTVIAERDPAGAITIAARLGPLADERRDRAFEQDAAKELRRLGAIRRPQP